MPSEKAKTVFVAYPWRVYSNRDRYKRAYTTLSAEFDISFVFAEDRLSSKHVLDKISRLIQAADFGIYDVTSWNANVTLEYGLAIALGKPAYIAFNPEKTDIDEVPADVRGFDRLQYADFDDLKEKLSNFLISGPDPEPLLSNIGAVTSPKLDVEILVRSSQIRAVDRTETGREAWIAGEIDRLLAPVLAQPRPTDPRDRTVDDYRDAVTTYIKRALPHLNDELNVRALSNGATPLQLVIKNKTPHNFSAAVLELSFPKGLRAFFGTDQARSRSSFPTPPPPWGYGRTNPLLIGGRSLRPPPSPDDALIDDFSGCTVEYLPVHLRPGAARVTRPLFLIADDNLAGQAISVQWRLSSRNTDGWLEGNIFLEVDDVVLTPSQLLIETA